MINYPQLNQKMQLLLFQNRHQAYIKHSFKGLMLNKKEHANGMPFSPTIALQSDFQSTFIVDQNRFTF